MALIVDVFNEYVVGGYTHHFFKQSRYGGFLGQRQQ